MSIKILSQPAMIDGLQDWGVVDVPLSQPATPVSGMEVALDGAGKNATGLWQCGTGSFARSMPQAEVMHILCGAGSFTATGEAAVAFRAGDTLFFPHHTTGTWEVTEPVRKLYVVLDDASASP